MKRKMITGERLMYVDANTPLNIVLTVKINGSFTLQALQVALITVQRKHPFLRVKIEENRKGQPYFVTDNEMSPIPVRIVDRTGDKAWEAQSKIEWEQLFDTPNAPMARVVWIKGQSVSELMLTCAHCICDGKSIVTLLREILLLTDHPDTRLKEYSLFGSVEELLSKKYSWSQIFMARIAALMVWRQFYFRSPDHRPRTGNNYLLHWKFGTENTRRLIESCRKNQTTVQAALCVIFSSAYASVTGKTAARILSPVDIRSFVPQIKEDMMFAMAPAVELSIDAEAGNFWQKAQQIKKDLHGKIKVMNSFMLKMAEYFPVRTMIKGLKAAVDNDFILSNLGLLNINEQYSSFEIETIYSITAAFPFASSNVVFVSTFKNNLDISFCANEGNLDQKHALLMREKVMQLLLEEVF